MPRHQLCLLALTTALTAVVISSAQAGEARGITGGIIQQANAVAEKSSGGPTLLPPGELPAAPPSLIRPPAPRLLPVSEGSATPIRPIPSAKGDAPTTQVQHVPPRAVIEVTPHSMQFVPRPTNASLYPVPGPNIPYQMGGTYYTNQALNPHEYLWEHTYKAIYPPYYYRAKGGWLLTPRGVWNHENWKLLGTEVTVKYRAHKPWHYGGLWKLPKSGFVSSPFN